MTSYTLGELARKLNAILDGDADIAVSGVASLEYAGATELTYAESDKYLERVVAGNAAAIIVAADFPDVDHKHLLRVERPKPAFVAAMELFAPDRALSGVHASAVIAADARLGDGAAVGPTAVIDAAAVIGARSRIRAGAYIGPNVQIGEDCDIGPNVVLMDDTRVGDRCILHPGVVIGADGYGYYWTGDHHHKIPQLGNVVIEDDVEIGANTCIDRATLGETRIGRGSKFDNLVQVAHNNQIGEHVILVSQVGIAGSSKLGKGVVAAGQVGIADHVTIGEGVQIGAQGLVNRDIAPGEKVWGRPAKSMTREMREIAAVGKLPEMLRDFRRQQKELEALRDRIAVLEDKLAK